MNNCSGVGKLASEILWDANETSHMVIVSIGIALTCFGCVSIWCLMKAHIDEARLGTVHLPPRTAWTKALLRLGIVMLALNCAELCYPEFATIFEIFEGMYKGYAYYCLWELIAIQFGGLNNLADDQGNGTLQGHEPAVIWANIPFCCVWGPFYLAGCMTPSKVTHWELRIMYTMMIQFLAVGPLTSAILVGTKIGVVSAEQISLVSTIFTALSILSLMFVIYATACIIKIAESCESITQQVKRHREAHSNLSLSATPDAVDETTVAKNLKPKNTYIVLVTALPALAAIVVSIAVQGDRTMPNGDVLSEMDRRAVWNAFATVVINFAGALLAWNFFQPEEEDNNVTEFMAGALLRAERIPAFALRAYIAECEQIIKTREANGVDLDLGVKPDKAMSELLDLDAPPGAAEAPARPRTPPPNQAP